MKFFSILIGVFIFCTSQAQDSTVCIPNKVARWFLEQNDEVILRRKEVKIQDQLISDLRGIANTKDLIIQSYKRDSVHYNILLTTNQEHLNLLYKDLAVYNKEIKRQKKLKVLALIGIGIVGILEIL